MHKGIGVMGAAVAVVAFGFVSVSIRMEGGGSGWPLHDALHPLIGLFLGPVYGPLSSVIGAALSEVVTPYTALDGWSPLLGGTSALATGLFVQGRRAWWSVWGIALLALGGVVTAGNASLVSQAHVLPAAAVLLCTAVPQVRTWIRTHLGPSDWSWKTAGALYGVSFAGSAIGLLALSGANLAAGTASVDISTLGTAFYVERTLLPLLSAFLGMALWPALQRRPFSVANQLRYGLPLFIVATFFFAGRLFMDQAYDATRTQTKERMRTQSQSAARILDTELHRAERLLRTRARREPTSEQATFFRWVERVPDGGALSRFSPSVQSLVRRVQNTGRPQRAFLPLPDTAAHGIGIAVPSETASNAPRDSVIVACVAPSAVQRTLSLWRESQIRLYLVDQDRQPVLDGRGPASSSPNDPEALVQALFAAPDATAEAPQGRYGTNVVGALAPLKRLSGHVVAEQQRTHAYFHVFEMLLSMALIVLVTGGGGLAVSFYVSRRVVAPLDRLIEAARRVGSGDLETRVSVQQDNELGELADTFNTMTGDLSASIQRLRANEERLRMALDAAQMGTWNWTAEPESITWSPQTYSILGVPESRSENLSEAFLARVHPADRMRVIQELESAFDDETGFNVEHRIQSSGEDVRWVRVRGRVYRENGHPQRMSGIIMDITARKEAEQELRAAKEEAEEMSRLKSAFLANVSHEIRTPLTSIIGFAEILVEEVPDPQRDQAEKVVRSARRLMQTLDSVLDLSKIEAGEFSLNCRPFDLTAEVHKQAELLEPMAERKGLEFVVDTPDECTEVALDSNCVDRVLDNLVTNAIKFTDEGRVVVRLRPTPSSITLQVCDEGVGIDEDFLPNLFDAFKQESEGLQREHDGTGLGLSITKELVELMDGEIEVESEKGEGTIFTVRFPYRLEKKTDFVL